MPLPTQSMESYSIKCYNVPQSYLATLQELCVFNCLVNKKFMILKEQGKLLSYTVRKQLLSHTILACNVRACIYNYAVLQ